MYFTDALVAVNVSCQSTHVPPSSSESSITTLQGSLTNYSQSVPINSTRRVPTYLTQSVLTNLTQRSINQQDKIA